MLGALHEVKVFLVPLTETMRDEKVRKNLDEGLHCRWKPHRTSKLFDSAHNDAAATFKELFHMTLHFPRRLHISGQYLQKFFTYLKPLNPT